MISVSDYLYLCLLSTTKGLTLAVCGNDDNEEPAALKKNKSTQSIMSHASCDDPGICVSDPFKYRRSKQSALAEKDT